MAASTSAGMINASILSAIRAPWISGTPPTAAAVAVAAGNACPQLGQNRNRIRRNHHNDGRTCDPSWMDLPSNTNILILRFSPKGFSLKLSA